MEIDVVVEVPMGSRKKSCQPFTELVKILSSMSGDGTLEPGLGQALKKPLKDANNAQLRLGQAYLAAGRKAEAKAAFAKVKTPEKDAMVAHLWFLAASH